MLEKPNLTNQHPQPMCPSISNSTVVLPQYQAHYATCHTQIHYNYFVACGSGKLRIPRVTPALATKSRDSFMSVDDSSFSFKVDWLSPNWECHVAFSHWLERVKIWHGRIYIYILFTVSKLHWRGSDNEDINLKNRRYSGIQYPQ